MSIKTVPIRATIRFGGLSISTPYILSFNVTKTRNSKSTFSASVKIQSSKLDSIIDNEIQISAGERGSEDKIFTGFILSSRPSICFDDPTYTVLNISGSDVLYRLEGEKYTRRQIDSLSRWGVIESVVRPAEKGGQFALVRDAALITDSDVTSNTEKKNKNTKVSDLSNFGVSNLTSIDINLNFQFSAVNVIGETSPGGTP